MVEVGSLNPLMAGLPLELLPQPSTLRIGNSNDIFAPALRQWLPSRLGSSHTPSTVAPAVRLGARRSAGLRSLDMQRRMG